jgi:hypothetical protein
MVMDGFDVSKEYTTVEIISTMSKLLTPAEPTGRLALIEDVDRSVWIKHATSCWSMVGSDVGCSWEWLTQTHGPVNILFEGVKDE